jgi:thymidylate synthase
MSILERSFEALVNSIRQEFLSAPLVEGTKWQSTTAPQPMVEILNRSFTFDLRSETELSIIANAVKPNLPWADRHFVEERVSGKPINPGETWKIWPYAASAAKHLREGENVPKYDHSYAERYWPKQAGNNADGPFSAAGIRFPIGDLNDLIVTLMDDPLTRQAYLPIFFPEDTVAASIGKRVPCTLGYHIICREGLLHIVYPMRSCDFIRHFRDDVYLTIRLLLWVLEQLKKLDPETWIDVWPGTFRMHITSLHMFKQDLENMKASMK